MQILSDDLNFLRQKLAILSAKDQDKAMGIRGEEAEPPKKGLEDKVRLLTQELAEKKSEVKHLERMVSDLKNQNQSLEHAIESLRMIVKQTEGKGGRFDRGGQAETEIEELRAVISDQERKIARLKAAMQEMDQDRQEAERQAGDVRRQLNGSVGNTKFDFQTKSRNNIEATDLRARLFRLQGEVAQKDLKIESLTQKLNYLKHRDSAQRRVQGNLNEFHRGLFSSFEAFKKRSG